MTTLLVGAVVLNAVIIPIDRWIRRYIAPDYYIVEEDNVLKVVGSISLTDIEHVESKLLQRRPNYRIDTDPYRRFGCTLAAVPASKEYLKAKDKLAKHGIRLR